MLQKPAARSVCGPPGRRPAAVQHRNRRLLSEYRTLKERGVEFEASREVRPYGTGVLMKDLCGNKIYLSQD
jgi:hypothetical protein